MRTLSRLWIPQTARLEWSDLATETVTLQQLEHGPCRDVFGVIGHDIVLNIEDATYYSASQGHEVALTRTPFRKFMPEFYGEARCMWFKTSVSIVAFARVQHTFETWMLFFMLTEPEPNMQAAHILYAVFQNFLLRIHDMIGKDGFQLCDLHWKHIGVTG